MALTNRSKLFLRKYQDGGMVNLETPGMNLNMDNNYQDYYSMSPPANIDQNLQPTYSAARNAAYLKYNPNRNEVPQPMQEYGGNSNPWAGAHVNIPKGQYVGGGYGETSGTDFADSIQAMDLPLVSSWFGSVNGLRNFIYSYEDKSRQEQYERTTKEEMLRRREEMRANNFYATPYSTTRYKNGGVVKDKKQYGGYIDQSNSVDSFMKYYSDQQDMKNQSLKRADDYYRAKNNYLKDQWKARQTQGLTDHVGEGIQSGFDYLEMFGGGMGGGGGAAAAMQQGGIVPESTATNVNRNPASYSQERSLPQRANDLKKAELENDTQNLISGKINLSEFIQKRGQFFGSSNKVKSKDRYIEKQEGGEIQPNEDLYSKDFQSPWQNNETNEEESQQFQTRIEAVEPGLGIQNSPNINQWIFEESPIEKYTTSDIYFKIFGKEESNEEELPIQPIADQFKQMGVNPSSINSGEHNTNSLHYQGRALDLGLNTSFKGDTKRMNEFYNYLTSEEGRKQFPNLKIRDERTKPQGQKVWNGSHLHIELND